jgi:hypothetical protein
VLPRHRALALRRIIDDDLRLLAVEKFEQQVELVGDVEGVIGVVLAFLDAQRERLGAQRIAAIPITLPGSAWSRSQSAVWMPNDPPPPRIA